MLVAAAAIAVTGCGGASLTPNPANTAFSISPGTASVDTNCTGCNGTDVHGRPVNQFAATVAGGRQAEVEWSLSGGDATAGPGSITATGQYTPPTYLTAGRALVVVTATLKSNPAVKATSVVSVTPGFLEPLTPQNVALGAGGTVTITGYLAEAGSGAIIHFSLAGTPTGSGIGGGSLGATTCEHSDKSFTTCTVIYTAPASIEEASVTYIVARAAESSGTAEAAVLLNQAGVASNPVRHQEEQTGLVDLGSSGGNNNDFDSSGNTIIDCCSGTLGALVRDGTGRQYLLSNNHVLARSDQASVGDLIVQPGLIDNNCTPNGDGAGTIPVASLTDWLPLSAASTNADAALAQVASHTVNPAGNILELGARLPNGTLAAAPPGISSSGGKGEPAALHMRVAKSGRTTGLTCGGVSAIALDVTVDYYRDCAETRPYLTKTFTNQIAISGGRFSDAGDSGALVVDTSNAEPVGLYFAGGTDSEGVAHAVANPAGDVLSELSTRAGTGTNYSFVGAADHPVSCLNYGDGTVSAAQSRSLSDAEVARAQQALVVARQLVSPANGILGVGTGKSSDHPGEAAVVVYVNGGGQARVPQTIDGVRTLVIPSTAQAVAMGSAPTSNSIASLPPLENAQLSHALAVKRRLARGLMRQTPSYFGVGVGQSLDDPHQPALVIYVDSSRIPVQLPAMIGGLRTRYVVMNRLHVTRSFAEPFTGQRHCTPHASTP